MLTEYEERPLFMDHKDFSNLGDQIRDSVQDAIDSMDFKQLNRTISDTVNFALDEARNQMMKGMDAARRMGIKNVIAASSYYCYGLGMRISGEPFKPDYLPIDENHPCYPEIHIPSANSSATKL